MISEIYNFFQDYLWGDFIPPDLTAYALDITKFISIVFAVALLVLTMRLVFGFIFRLIDWLRG